MIENPPDVSGSAFGIVAAIVVAALALVIALGPRGSAASSLLVGLLLVPIGNRIDVAGVNFNSARILLTVGALVMFSRAGVLLAGRSKGGAFADASMAAYPFVLTVVWSIREGLGNGLAGGFGYGFDLAFAYFVGRYSIQSLGEYRRFASVAALVAAISLMFGIIEFTTLANPAKFLGGVLTETVVRDGWPRVQGAWVHPILYGVGWASLVPICLSSTRRVLGVRLAGVGAGCAGGLVLLSGSSSSLSVFIVVAVLLPLWRLARYRNEVFVLLVSMGIALHFLMNGPVWSLLAKANFFSGSTGWHRFAIVDNAIMRFGDWAIGGITSTAGWGPGLWDVTNTFVLVGVRGGFGSLVLFLVPICVSVWLLWGLVPRIPSLEDRKTFWLIGVSIQASAIAFLSVGYVGQSLPLFGLLLGIANSAVGFASRSQRNREMVIKQRAGDGSCRTC